MNPAWHPSRITTAAPVPPLPPTAVAAGLRVRWARHLDDVRAAQRLRHAVFALEMGARLTTPVPGHDIDLFDDFCEHLLVCDAATDAVIGTYRVLTPAQARRVGSTYSDTEFDLTRLRQVRERMVELGRSCVHADHRTGGVILALWSALGAFMVRNRLDVMIGCASVPMHHDGRWAASLWRQLARPTWRRSTGMCVPVCRCRWTGSTIRWPWSRPPSSGATCAWAPRCSARRPGTPTSTAPTCP